MHKNDLTYQICGIYSQYLAIDLAPDQSIIAQAEMLMMMEPDIILNKTNALAAKKTPGFLKKAIDIGIKLLKKENMLLTMFSNPTESTRKIMLKPSYPGKILTLELGKFNGEFYCQSSSFLAASSAISVGMESNHQPGKTFSPKEGVLTRKLKGQGTVFLQAGGDVIKKILQKGEVVHVAVPNLVGFSKEVSVHTQPIITERKRILGNQAALMAKLEGPGLFFMQLFDSEYFNQKFMSFIGQQMKK